MKYGFPLKGALKSEIISETSHMEGSAKLALMQLGV